MPCFGSLGLVPGHRPTPLIGGHAVVVNHIQNRGRVAWMLAQGESSSAKTNQPKKWITDLKSKTIKLLGENLWRKRDQGVERGDLPFYLFIFFAKEDSP